MVKVVDTDSNEWTFLEAHRAQLSELRLVNPRTMLRDFLPGVSVLVMPKLVTLCRLRPELTSGVLPELISVSLALDFRTPCVDREKRFSIIFSEHHCFDVPGLFIACRLLVRGGDMAWCMET